MVSHVKPIFYVLRPLRRARGLTGIFFALQLIIMPQALALVVSASVDTTNVRMGDTLRLTIRIDESNKGNEPNLDVLEKDFRILGKQFGSSTRLTNRGINTESNWIINLLPKHKGSLTIPAIDFDGVMSRPITINVSEEPQSAAQNTQQLVFLEAEVDAAEVYVQQQVIFTLRLYKRTELHDPSLVMPDVEGAVQEKLGSPRAFNKVIDGRDYEVVENRFAYFPQKSGTLLIPPAELDATIAVGGNGFLDPFLGMMGKQIRRLSKGIEVKVNPKPDTYPPNAAWLPTTQLKIEESIHPDKQEFKVGEPITRIITLEAAGVAPSLLPPLPVPEGSGYKVYPEPADTQGLPDARGVSSRRVETQAYIPTQAGTLTLPAIEIAYWNVQENKLDKAILPERNFTIMNGASSGTLSPSLPNDSSQNALLQDCAHDNAASAPPLLQGQNISTTATWQWLTLALMITWLMTLAVWFAQWRKAKKHQSDTLQQQHEKHAETLTNKRNTLMHACKQNQPVVARKALIAWFKQLDATHPIHSLGHIRLHAMSALLASAASELEHALYCPAQDNSWNCEALRKGIADEESQRRIKQREAKSHLHTLHP